MSTLTLAIVIVFCIGYLFIAIESVTKINKAAIALLMLVATWTLFMISPDSYLLTAIGEQLAAVVSEAIVPIFKSITHLPPFVGILLVLGVLWTVTEVFYSLKSLGFARKFVCTYRLKWESDEKPNMSLMSVNERRRSRSSRLMSSEV